MRLIIVGLLNLLALPAAGAVALSFLFSRRRALLARAGLSERFGRAEGLPQGALWVHAASAGEVAAVSPLLKELDGPVFVTCTTALGVEAARKLGLPASLAPIDFAPAVAAFLKRTLPKALLVVETELWPTTLYLAKEAGLRLAVVNGRFSPERYWRYKLARPLFAPFVSLFDRIAAQTADDALRYVEMGARPEAVKAVGNLKYDVAPPAPRALAGEGPVWVAGSTHPGEEDVILEAFRLLPRDWRLVIAPRHVERAGELRRRLPDARVTLIDTFGVLPSYYGPATAAFVGGTLVPVGGHNVMEPVLAGTPVLFGPHTSHTAQAARMILEAGCGFEVRTPAELAEGLERIRKEPGLRAKAAGLAAGLRGASGRALEHLGPVVKLV